MVGWGLVVGSNEGWKLTVGAALVLGAFVGARDGLTEGDGLVLGRWLGWGDAVGAGLAVGRALGAGLLDGWVDILGFIGRAESPSP